MSTKNRRDFLKASLGTGLYLYGSSSVGAAESGDSVWGPEWGEYTDERTGARVRMLTQGASNDVIVYQTHPMWTPNMKYLVFQSNRAGYSAPHALRMKTGKIHVITDFETGLFVIARKDDCLYAIHGQDLVCVHVAKKSQAGKKITSQPDWISGLRGGLSLDADEKVLYTGAELEKDKKWALVAVDLQTGVWRILTELDFLIGHVQANPFQSGVVMFCHETGGDAPQRTWVLKNGATRPEPFYKETYGEWVTHEVWWRPDRAIFTIWPYDEEHTQKPHGILSADLKTGKPVLHSQYRAWHTHGSPDGKWAMGDDFDRNIWLVRVETGERRLLTQGHLGKGCKTHPHGSFTPDGKGIVFNSSRNGSENIFLAELPDDFETLPLAEEIEINDK